MRRLPIPFAAIAVAALFAAPAARAFQRLDSLDVGDELPAGVLDGDEIRLAASRDGRHLYVVGDLADTLLLFSVHPYGGQLTLEETYGAPSPGFDVPNDAILTPDEHFLIVSQRGIFGISVFARNASDGTLTLVDQQRDGIAGVTGLANPERLALDPAGRHLYVLTTDSVVVFARESDGTLEFVEDETAGFVDSFWNDSLPTLAVSHDGKHLYAVSPDDGHVVVYARDAATGALSFVETENAGGTLVPSALAVAPEGGFVYVATHPDCDTGGIAIFARNETTGQLTYASTEVVEYHCLPTPRIEIRPRTGELCFPRVGLSVSPDAAYRCFRRDPATGALDPVDAGTGNFGSGFDPVSDVFAAGEFLFAAEPVTSPNDAARITSTGFPVLLPLETQQDSFDGVTALDGAIATEVSPDGRHVYVASRFDGAVQIFARDGETGVLEALGEVRNGSGGITSLNTPTDLAISADGKHVYVTASLSDALTVFSRNAASGALTLVDVERDEQNGVTLFQAPSGVTVSADGRFVLATSAGEDAVVSFARNAGTGALTFADDYTSSALDGASDVAVSRDGAHAYVTADTGNSLAALSIDAAGALSHVQTATSLFVQTSLYGARDVVVSPDGKHIYVAGLGDPRVTAYARNATTGGFGFIEAFDAEPGGVTAGLGGGDGLAITSDGRFVFAGDVHADTQDVLRLTYWRRDPATGRLFIRGFDQGSTDHIAVSPDGRNVYVASFGSDRLAVFAPEPGFAASGAGAFAALGWLATRARRRRR